MKIGCAAVVTVAIAVVTLASAPVAHADEASYYLDRVHTYAFGNRYDDFDWLAERNKVCAAKANGASIGDLWAIPKKDLPLLTDDDATMVGSLASLSCR
jgi:hypothetical protein